MKYTSINYAYAVLAFVIIFFALTSFAFADSRARSESRRAPSLSKVLTILEEHVPEQANSPEAVAEALANPIGNSASSNGAGEAGNNPIGNSASSNGAGGGATAGNGGNGGNSSPGGLVKAGGAVSNSTAINAINTVILRISFR